MTNAATIYDGLKMVCKVDGVAWYESGSYQLSLADQAGTIYVDGKEAVSFRFHGTRIRDKLLQALRKIS